jgi:flagellar basal-body rod protein FlgB
VTGSVDAGLEFYRQVLDLRADRQQILTADIANASTPGFKAVDLDFRAALDAATSAPTADDPQSSDETASRDADAIAAAIKYQIGAPVTLDGNSVNLDQEKLAAGENAIQYEAAASFASQIIKMLTVAINGSGAQPSSSG